MSSAVFASIFYRCGENISFRGHVLALNFGQYNQDKPFKKKDLKMSIFGKKLLEEVTMVVKEIFLKKQKQFLGRKWRQPGPEMHPSRNAISYTSFRCHGNSIS